LDREIQQGVVTSNIMGNERNGYTRLMAFALMISPTLSGFIDMDTPLEARTTKSLVDGTVYKLVSTMVHFFDCCSSSASFFILF
jgi:hypothetical protein